MTVNEKAEKECLLYVVVSFLRNLEKAYALDGDFSRGGIVVVHLDPIRFPFRLSRKELERKEVGNRTWRRM